MSHGRIERGVCEARLVPKDDRRGGPRTSEA
jgi:hypothetical protein